MIKKIDANKYGVVRYAISSIEDIADLPREVSVGSEAILVNEDGEKKFKLGSDGWVEVVEVKEYDEDKLRDILEDAKVGYGGIEYETLEERLDKDFDNVYSVLDNRTYVGYEGCRITAKDSLNGLQKETVVKGRTLQNIVPTKIYNDNSCYRSLSSNARLNGTTVSCVASGEYENIYANLKVFNLVKQNTDYTIILTIHKNTLEGEGNLFTFSNKDQVSQAFDLTITSIRYGLSVGVYKFVGRLKNDISECNYLFRTSINKGATSGEVEFSYYMLEGDHTQTPLEELPYIEGIKSVGDKSKNLFDGVLEKGNIVNTTGENEPSISSTRTPNFIKIKCPFTFSRKMSGGYVGFRLYDKDKNFISAPKTNGLSITINEPNAEYVRFVVVDGTVDDYMIKEGTQATPYEPYYDGYKISGKSCGKNLIDLSKMIPHAKIDHKIEGNKVILVGNEPYPYVLTKIPIDVRMISGKRLRMSADSITSTSEINQKVKLLQLNVTYLDGSMAYHGVMTGKKDQIFTLGKNIAYAYVCFYTNNTENYEMGKTVIINPMLEIQENDPTSTPYEPYKETTYSYILGEPLRSLPNGVCDEIDLEKGIVTRRVGKYTFTGDESTFGEATEVTGDVTTTYLTIHDRAKGEENNVICNSLACYPYGLYEDIQGILVSSFSCFVLSFKNGTLKSNDIEGIRQWLKDNPTTVYYELANPTTEYLIKDDKFVTLPNGVKDEISHNSVLRKVGKIVLDGSQVLTRSNTNNNKTKTTHFMVMGIEANSPYGISDKLENQPDVALASYEKECFKLSPADKSNPQPPYSLWINIDRSKADTVEEAYEYLKNNPITVWYELITPTVEPLNLNEVILNTIRLKSYEPITHITSDNYLPPTIKTQVPSDFNAVVLGLKSNNKALTSQVMSLRQTNDELEVTNREQDDVIDVTLLALDEVYGMIDEGEIETMSVGSPMVNVYVKMIKRGIKTLDEVPAKYRAEVEELI